MGWAYCGQDEQGRDIGYAVPATCDEPGCEAEIHRGLAYACGGMHLHNEYGCGGYFCYEHLMMGGPRQMCRECLAEWERLGGD